MFHPIMKELATKRIVLASSSPRRQEIFKNIGLNALLYPSLFEENLKPEDFPNYSDFVEETALQKVLDVSNRIAESTNPFTSNDLIIGADTIVTLDGVVFGKPKTAEIAFDYLTKLMDKAHIVYTGVAIKHGEDIFKFTESTVVEFGKATPEQIQAYVDTGEPLDKAGGYGIQGVGGTMIKKINGDYFTVMGFPLYRFCTELCRMFNYPVVDKST